MAASAGATIRRYCAPAAVIVASCSVNASPVSGVGASKPSPVASQPERRRALSGGAPLTSTCWKLTGETWGYGGPGDGCFSCPLRKIEPTPSFLCGRERRAPPGRCVPDRHCPRCALMRERRDDHVTGPHGEQPACPVVRNRVGPPSLVERHEAVVRPGCNLLLPAHLDERAWLALCANPCRSGGLCRRRDNTWHRPRCADRLHAERDPVSTKSTDARGEKRLPRSAAAEGCCKDYSCDGGGEQPQRDPTKARTPCLGRPARLLSRGQGIGGGDRRVVHDKFIGRRLAALNPRSGRADMGRKTCVRQSRWRCVAGRSQVGMPAARY